MDTQALSPTPALKQWPFGQPWALGVYTSAVQSTPRDGPREKSTQTIEGAWAIWARIFKAGSRKGAGVAHPHLDPMDSLPVGGPPGTLEAQSPGQRAWLLAYIVFMFKIVFMV